MTGRGTGWQLCSGLAIEALAEAARRPAENGLQSVYDDLTRGWLPASTGAAKPQVASPNPQVGFLGRAFHWLFGRTS